jgi:hypothetical protein
MNMFKWMVSLLTMYAFSASAAVGVVINNEPMGNSQTSKFLILAVLEGDEFIPKDCRVVASLTRKNGSTSLVFRNRICSEEGKMISRPIDGVAEAEEPGFQGLFSAGQRLKLTVQQEKSVIEK